MTLVLWVGPGQFTTRRVEGNGIPSDNAKAAALCAVLNGAGDEFARQLGERAVQKPWPKLFLVEDGHPLLAPIVWWDLAVYCRHGLFYPHWVRNDVQYRADNGATIAEYEARLAAAPQLTPA